MTELITPVRLTRDALASTTGTAAGPPTRIVHLGLGAFHRAHQAWYTAQATDADDWGITAFTGRSRDLADRLTPQGGVYALVERGADGDRVEIVTSIVRAEPGDDVRGFVTALADPNVAILTLTVTEAGYRLTPEGRLDIHAADVRADIELLRAGERAAALPTTVLGRVLLGLDARRRADAPPLAIVPCDNLPDNGRVVGNAIHELAEDTIPELATWLPYGTRFVSTSVDRITPRITAADLDALRLATGWVDEAPVITEPFSDWVLCGEFPTGRPHWEAAGARFVDDIEPWENRKLWMLNGAHTLLALLGRLRGHDTIAQAIGDPVLLAAADRLWNESARHLPGLDVDAYRAALLDRFRNPRIEHRLTQIAEDSLTKLRVRIVPVALRERAAGRPAAACATAIAAWIVSIAYGQSPSPTDPAAATADHRILLTLLDRELGSDPAFSAEVDAALAALAGFVP